MIDDLVGLAETPAGMLILAAAAFVLCVLAVTLLIFWIGSLVRGKKKSIEAEESDARATVNEPDPDPLESFDPDEARRSAVASKAPIGLARLRAAGPDITAAQEPLVPGAAQRIPSPLPAVVEADPLKVLESPAATPQAEPVLVASGNPPVLEATAPPIQPQQSRQEPPCRIEPEPVRAPFIQTPAKIQPKAADPFRAAGFLLTLPFERREGLSIAHADLCGMGVEAVFFDAQAAAAESDAPLRLVPFLPAGRAKLLVTEVDRETFRAGALFAQPDAVLELDEGLIALEYKSKGGRPDDPLRWAEAMRTKDLMQTALNALALSASSGRPAAPVLRTTNAVFFLRPQPELKTLLCAHLDEAQAFLESSSEGAAKPGISASDYALLISPAVERLYPRAPSKASLAGAAAHDEMLRA